MTANNYGPRSIEPEELVRLDLRMMSCIRCMMDSLLRASEQFPTCGAAHFDLGYVQRQLEHIETWLKSGQAVLVEFRNEHG
jgi:hypothetical protein